MRQRRVLWHVPVLVLAMIGAMAVSVLAMRPAESPVVVFVPDRLDEMSRQPIPPGVRIRPGTGKTPQAFWLVQNGAHWQAFADRETSWRGCPLDWEANADRFVDRCGSSVYDRSGRLTGGFGDRNLDQFAVTLPPEGSLSVDLSRLQSGADAPLVVLRAYVNALHSHRREDAWRLIHPDRQSPEAPPQFLEAPALAGPYRIEGQRPVSMWADRLQQAGQPGGRTWDLAVRLTVRWADGIQQEIHLVPDASGNWRLLWSAPFGLE